MRKGLLFLALLFCGLSVSIAQRTITGTVTEAESNEPIIGASVIVKGASSMIGVSTDINGKFTITVPENLNSLIVSAAGRKAKEVNVSGSSSVSVALDEDVQTLKAIEVSGYGVSRKAAFTGAAATVGEELITKQSGANVITNLQGAVPGVNISITSGSPGSSSPVRIRGLGSVAGSNDPLYIIDGVPFSAGDWSLAGGQTVDPLAGLNPEDIANISFLKDAAATSIYGSRASGGVIVITTKRGETGKSTINFNMRVGVNDKPAIRRNYQLLDREDYFEYLRTSLLNSNRIKSTDSENAQNAYIKRFYGVDVNDPTNEDWWDAITRRGIIQDYSLSASGGNENNKYYISGNYFQDKGSIIGSGTQRYSVRVNLENKLNKYFTLDNSLMGAFTRTDGLEGETYYANPILAARSNQFFQPVKDTAGNWNFSTSASGQNPVARVEDEIPNIIRTDVYKLIYSPTIRLQLLKDLFIQVKGGLDYTLSHGTTVMNPLIDPDGQGVNGLHQDIRYQGVNLVNTNTINWLPQFGKHGLNVLLAQETYKEYFTYSTAASSNFASAKLIYALENGADPYSVGGNKDVTSLLSFFSNVEYDYDDKYYFSVSVRGDGSSRFTEEHRWGAFFSVGAKYRITQENFMRSVDNWLQNLTFRISYGTTGNQDVLNSYHPAKGFYAYDISYNGNPGSYFANLYDENLTWETRNKFNVGFDATLADRINIEFDYFYDVVDNMLFPVQVSRTTGFTSIYRNIGAMSNTGVEGTLNFLLVKSKNVNWTFNLNFATCKNEVLRMDPDSMKSNAVLRTAGLPWNTIWVANLYEIESETGDPVYLLANGTTTKNVALARATENRIVAGISEPIINGGFGTRLEFFGFDLSAQFIYSLGGVSFNDDGQFHELTNDLSGRMPANITYYAWENSWKQAGDEGKTLPAIKSNRPADHFWALWTKQNLHNMSYLKLRNVTIGYTLPKKIVNKAKMTNVRAYFSCDNLFSLYHKSYRGFDTNPIDLAQENAGFNYPISRNYIFGLNITF